jgi:hypothetical protein
MAQVKFYRVETLPEVGEVGSLYFVYGSGGVQSLLYICVGTGLFELYTPDLYELENKLDSLEDKVEEESQAIQHKINNIDLSSVAKQGENKEATLTAIYKLLIGSNEPSPDIPEGVEERLALILEFFGIKPIESYEFMTAEEVCSELEEIMTSMDLELTQEKAKEITNNTLNKG